MVLWILTGLTCFRAIGVVNLINYILRRLEAVCISHTSLAIQIIGIIVRFFYTLIHQQQFDGIFWNTLISQRLLQILSIYGAWLLTGATLVVSHLIKLQLI